MSAPASRRGFLRGLTTLPLIGGGVTLLGSPTAVAERRTEVLLREYATWIAHEHYRAQIELHGTMRMAWYGTHGPAFAWHAAPLASEPSTRAALVLGTVGCDWREDRR